jgi:hypothetical protein
VIVGGGLVFAAGVLIGQSWLRSFNRLASAALFSISFLQELRHSKDRESQGERPVHLPINKT